MVKKLRVDIVGAGRWGPNLIRAFSELHQIEVRCIYDQDSSRTTRVQKTFPSIKIASSMPDLLAGDSEAVVVATPVKTHAALAREVLEAGKHLFIEKPFCSTSSEAWELVDLAQSRELIIHVGHVFLFSSSIGKVKNFIEDGSLGTIQYIEAKRTNLGPVRDDVNAIWDLASHDISIINYWLGCLPEKISSSTVNVLENGPADVGFTNLLYENKTFGAIHVSWLSPQKIRQITVVGSRKMLVWDDMDVSRPIQIFDSSITRLQEVYSDSFASHRLTYHQGDITIPFIGGEPPLSTECQHFIDCIRNGACSRSDGIFGTRIVEILEASDNSVDEEGVWKTILYRKRISSSSR